MSVIATVTPAARRSLVTATMLQEELGALVTGKTTPQLEVLAGRVTAMVEGYCQRNQLARERVRERFYLREGMAAILERTPVLTVHEVRAYGMDGSSKLLSADEWRLEAPEGGVVRIAGTMTDILLRSPAAVVSGGWPYGWTAASEEEAERRVEIEYTGGWVTAGWTGGETETLPADISHACILLVKNVLERQARPLDVQSERLGDVSWTYGRQTDGAEGAGIPTEIQAMLWRYRKPIL